MFQNWSLQIRGVHIDDAGEYLCQTSQHPPSSVMVRLAVYEAWADIVGSEEKVFRSARQSVYISSFNTYCHYTGRGRVFSWCV